MNRRNKGTRIIGAVILAGCMLLNASACGKVQETGNETEASSAGGSDVMGQTEASAGTGTAGSVDGSPRTEVSGQKEEGSGEPAKDISGDGPSLMRDVCLKHRYDNEWRDNQYSLLNYDYEQIFFPESLEALYPKLTPKLYIINDLIATEESNCRMKALAETQKLSDEEVKEAGDKGTLPRRGQWRIYVRRADSEVFSLVARTALESPGKGDHVTYRCSNLRSGTGEDISLSDVVLDEDAFCSLIAEKANETASGAAGNGNKTELTGAEIKAHLDGSPGGNWTLDPQGVSVWFGSDAISPEDACVSVLYAEDTGGGIFKEDVIRSSPRTWTMYFPLSLKTRFDADEDGKADLLTVNEKRDRYEEGGYEYCTGLTMDYNGRQQEFADWDELYEIRLSLIHMYGETFLLNECREYEYSMMDIYALSKDSVIDTGSIYGSPVTLSEVKLPEDEYIYPDCLLTDPESIRVSTMTDMLSTCGSERDYVLRETGRFEPVEPWYVINDPSRYTITPLVWLKDVPVVDESTHEVTSERVTLRPGDRITMEYTDDSTYSDCRTQDGKLVRIEVHSDDEFGRYVLSGDQKVEVFKAFDDMMFAG
ncbi:MAG: hypothetical protein IJT00_01765 [Lachnospiraceae bacterium]|nr:hypothetical protein [Lachnospiraceae bacterium]